MSKDLIAQLLKLPLPVVGTVAVCAGVFIPNIQPPMVQDILIAVGIAILTAAGVHISGIGGNDPQGGAAA